jgi:hypothetical protein
MLETIFGVADAGTFNGSEPPEQALLGLVDQGRSRGRTAYKSSSSARSSIKKQCAGLAMRANLGRANPHRLRCAQQRSARAGAD